MGKIIFISGPCGCGKTTFANKYAKHLANKDGRTVYVIHGDDFHDGFAEPDNKGYFFVDGVASDQVKWENILRFNWDCIIATAGRALEMGLDVVIDYVIEGELSRIKKLADKHGAKLYYIVLTADEDELEKRIRARGDTDLIERSRFLKNKLETLPENQGHLYDNTRKDTDEMIMEISIEDYILQ